MNKELIRRVAEKLRRMRHSQHYNQKIWGKRTACGTSACIAGHIAIEAGAKLVGPNHFLLDDKVVDARDLAAKELGMQDNWYGTTRLFSGTPSKVWPGLFARRWALGKEPKHRIAADLLDAIADGTVKL